MPVLSTSQASTCTSYLSAYRRHRSSNVHHHGGYQRQSEVAVPVELPREEPRPAQKEPKPYYQDKLEDMAHFERERHMRQQMQQQQQQQRQQQRQGKKSSGKSELRSVSSRTRSNASQEIRQSVHDGPDYRPQRYLAEWSPAHQLPRHDEISRSNSYISEPSQLSEQPRQQQQQRQRQQPQQHSSMTSDSSSLTIGSALGGLRRGVMGIEMPVFDPASSGRSRQDSPSAGDSGFSDGGSPNGSVAPLRRKKMAKEMGRLIKDVRALAFFIEKFHVDVVKHPGESESLGEEFDARLRPLLIKVDEAVVSLEDSQRRAIDGSKLEDALLDWLVHYYEQVKILRKIMARISSEVVDPIERVLRLQNRGAVLKDSEVARMKQEGYEKEHQAIKGRLVRLLRWLSEVEDDTNGPVPEMKRYQMNMMAARN